MLTLIRWEHLVLCFITQECTERVDSCPSLSKEVIDPKRMNEGVKIRALVVDWEM
jgi:hypothetical protein